MAEDLGERTEDPTARRLEEAREKGQVARSADLSAVVVLAAALCLLLALAQWMFAGSADLLRAALSPEFTTASMTTGTLIPDLLQTLTHAAKMALPAMLTFMLVAFVGGVSQVGWHLTAAPLEPKWSKLNPISGVKNVIGPKALVKGGIDLLKFILVGTVGAMIIRGDWDQITAMANLDILSGLIVAAELIRELAIWIIAVLVVLAIVDLSYQRFQFKRDQRMTKQQIKEERKSNEGDMDVKARRMKIARQIAMQRLSTAVPKADVIVTNPTHYAVALKYDAEEGMRAPRVIAKGADYLALKMRYLASSSGVPIVERPPLARALYHNVAVGKEIFPEHYEAVAEVLAYVYRLENRAAPAA